MNIRPKVILSSFSVLLVLLVSVLAIVIGDIKTTQEAEVTAYRQDAVKEIRSKLKDFVDLAYTEMELGYRRLEDKEYIKKQYGGRLISIVDVAGSLIEYHRHLSEEGTLTPEEAKKSALQALEKLRYDNGTGYIWVNNTARPYPTMLMHPVSKDLVGKVMDSPRFDKIAENKTKHLFSAILDVAEAKGEGFVDYAWYKKTGTELIPDVPKLSYVRLFPEWGWVVGTGIYLDDVKKDILEDIKHNIKIMRYDQGTGYFWINDTARPYPSMIMHPIKPELNGQTLNAPIYNSVAGTKQNLFQAFVDTTEFGGAGYVEYLWPKPSTQGATKEDFPKLSYVRQHTGLGWIVGTGVYIDSIDATLQAKQKELKARLNKLLRNAGLNMLLIFGLAVVALSILSKRVAKPLSGIEEQMRTLALGHFPKTEVTYHSKDEIGRILTSFNLLRDRMQTMFVQLKAIAGGDYNQMVNYFSEGDELAGALSDMTGALREATAKNAAEDWLKSGLAALNEQMRGEQEPAILAGHIIAFLTPYVDAQVGIFYVSDEEIKEDGSKQLCLKLLAGYAYEKRKRLANTFEYGEGLAGQAALERKMILLEKVPEDYLPVKSGIGEATPCSVLVIPYLYEDAVKGVIELGSFSTFSNTQIEFLKQAMPSIAIAVNTADSRRRMEMLLQQTQIQAGELQSQSEELQSQTEELQVQQEELRQTNEELELRTADLERQKAAIHEQNKHLEKAQQAIETKARELELASKYKSEFLANMSHELRTPLNSMLILAQMLADNREGNMQEKQKEQARTIHNAGAELLNLINDILDLSKVEAGHIHVQPEVVALDSFIDNIEQKFRHMAEQAKISFEIKLSNEVPEQIISDSQRLRQIITNLLSNAFKFTHQGGVTLDIHRPSADDLPDGIKIPATEVVAFSVRDTGIGISKDKQLAIFEAFQQEDGTTSRKYGGTGLGLSISKQLARLMNGEIALQSEEGKGSCFTLYLPEHLSAKDEDAKAQTPAVPAPKSIPASTPAAAIPEMLGADENVPEVKSPPKTETATEKNTDNSTQGEPPPDDRENLAENEKSILIIEDDRKFSGVLIELAHEQNYKCLLAEDGQTGLELARQYKPTAVMLDVGLPQLDGFSVLEALKDDMETRHIPVHIMSAADYSMDAKKMGAVDYLMKPVNMTDLNTAFEKIEHFANDNLRNLLVLSDKKEHGKEILDLIGTKQVQSHVVYDADEAYQELQQNEYDCLILDINTRQESFLDLLDRLRDNPALPVPVIVNSAGELSAKADKRLQQYANSMTVKPVYSPERLLDEATLFLHQLNSGLSQEKRSMLNMVHDKETILRGKNLLIVDDDMRNTYALLSFLEDKEINVLVAVNGQKALETLENGEKVDIILMDIMMPEMDGYETMRRIRKQNKFRKLPIIALTAKSMKEDKAKCLEAGANDYLSKPVDNNKLLSLLRVWLYR